MRKNLLITFDYELYLGNRSGTIHDCMIIPTRELIELLGKFGIRAIFFVDTTYLLRLREASENYPVCLADYRTVTEQLRELVRKGHYVFPHVHPHWLDAEYLPDLNEWQLNNITRYRFHSISDEEKSKVFDGSVELLQSELLGEFPDYQVNAYRAGGWCIQPFTDFMPYFEKHQIKYEFSVLSGAFQFTDAQYFDFSNAPEKNIYRFSTDVCKEDNDGPFTEFNISCVNLTSSKTFFNKIWLRTLNTLVKDPVAHKGQGQPSHAFSGLQPVSNRGRDLGHPGMERVSIEMLSTVKLENYIRFLDSNPYMHFISHPKMINGHNLAVFNRFLTKAFEKYQITSDFQKMIHG